MTANSYGSTWFTLERRLAYPFTPMRFAQLLEADLSDFDTIVLPDGSAGAYRDRLGEAGVERIKGWIEGGGTLVTWGGGAAFAAQNGLLSATLLAESDPAPEEEAAACLATIDRLVSAGAVGGPPRISPSARPCALQSLAGAALLVRPDPTHWLANGLGDEPFPVLARGSSFLSLSERGATPLAFADEGSLVASGFAWPDNTERWLAGQAYAVADPLGSGQVIAFSSEPNFRAFWRGTSRVFANAVLLGASMTSSARRSW